MFGNPSVDRPERIGYPGPFRGEPSPERPDMVSHPTHYMSENGIETIDVIEAFTSDLTGMEAVDTGNIIKYICRWKRKNGLEDLKKAAWYLQHLINHIEEKEIK